VDKNKVHRKTFPRVREVVKDGELWYICDSRKRGFAHGKQTWCHTVAEALEEARKVADGFNSGTTLSEEERTLFLYFRGAIQPYGKTVKEVMESALARLEIEASQDDTDKAKTTVAALVDLWIDEKQSGKFSNLREVTKREIRSTGKLIKKLWGELQVKEVTKQQVQEFIGNHPGRLVTKRNNRVRIGGFFNWCTENGYGNENPAKNIKIDTEDSKSPETVSLADVKAMLVIAQSDPRYRPLIKYLALGFFAGLRPDEIRRLPKENINLSTGQIFIAKEITKTKTERFVTINETLLAFLNAFPDGTIYHPNFIKLFKGIRQKIGYGFNGIDGKHWIPDGIRHTFGSMWKAKHKNIYALAHEMGNSPEVINKHYGRAIPAQEVEEFWAIRPLQPAPV